MKTKPTIENGLQISLKSSLKAGYSKIRGPEPNSTALSPERKHKLYFIAFMAFIALAKALRGGFFLALALFGGV